MSKCVLNTDKTGNVTSVDIQNNNITKEEVNEAKFELLDRNSATKKIGEKARRTIERVKSETSEGSTSKEVWETIAKEEGTWIEDYEEGKEFMTQGGEQLIYVDPTDLSTVTKVNHDIDNLVYWVENLIDFNQMFPSTAYEIVGFTKLNRNHYDTASLVQGIGAKGNFSVVLKQKFIPNKQVITPTEVENYMNYIGFERMGMSNDYTNGDVIVGDVNVDNLIKDNDGNYHMIDAYVEIENREKDELLEELKTVENISTEQALSIVDVVNTVYKNIANRLKIPLDKYKRRIAFKTVQSVDVTIKDLRNSLQGMSGITSEFINNLTNGASEELYQGTFGVVEKKYLKNSGLEEGDYILSSVLGLDDYFKFLGYSEKLSSMGKKKALVEIERRLEDIHERAKNTNDFYIKEISKSFAENGLKRAQNQQELEVYQDIINGDSYAITTQLENFQNQQKSELLSSLDYLIPSKDYSSEFKYLMIGLILKGNNTKGAEIETKDKNEDGSVILKRVDGKYLTRGNTTVGNHQELSSMVLPNVYEELNNGSELHPMELIDKHTDKSYITKEETAEIIKDRIYKKQEDGVWVKFEQSNSKIDVEALTKVSKKVAKVMKENPWCTGGGMSTTYLPKGDFYLFLDNELEPKVTIRYDGEHIAELKGIDSGQALETSQVDNVDNFLKEILNGKDYKVQVDLFKLKKKLENNEDFSDSEYINLVESLDENLETYDRKLLTKFKFDRIAFVIKNYTYINTLDFNKNVSFNNIEDLINKSDSELYELHKGLKSSDEIEMILSERNSKLSEPSASYMSFINKRIDRIKYLPINHTDRIYDLIDNDINKIMFKDKFINHLGANSYDLTIDTIKAYSKLDNHDKERLDNVVYMSDNIFNLKDLDTIELNKLVEFSIKEGFSPRKVSNGIYGVINNGDFNKFDLSNDIIKKYLMNLTLFNNNLNYKSSVDFISFLLDNNLLSEKDLFKVNGYLGKDSKLMENKKYSDYIEYLDMIEDLKKLIEIDENRAKILVDNINVEYSKDLPNVFLYNQDFISLNDTTIDNDIKYINFIDFITNKSLTANNLNTFFNEVKAKEFINISNLTTTDFIKLVSNEVRISDSNVIDLTISNSKRVEIDNVSIRTLKINKVLDIAMNNSNISTLVIQDISSLRDYYYKNTKIKNINLLNNDFNISDYSDILKKLEVETINHVKISKLSNNISNSKLNQDSRGAIIKSDKVSLVLLDKMRADVTTPLHEIAHEYERVLNKTEIEHIENWSGNKKGTVEFSEAFSKGFERYIYEGTTFNKDVDGVFERFKIWLLDLIQDFKEYFGDINELNDEMKTIYSKMLIDGGVSEANNQIENAEIEDVELTSELFKSLTEIPLLNSDQALEIYKQSQSTKLEDWDTLDLNC